MKHLRVAAAVAACLFSSGAHAQFMCLMGPPVEDLYERSGEEPLIQMQIGNGPEAATTPALLAVSPEGVWTLYYQHPSGQGVCVVAHGSDAKPAEGRGFPKPVIPGEDS